MPSRTSGIAREVITDIEYSMKDCFSSCSMSMLTIF